MFILNVESQNRNITDQEKMKSSAEEDKKKQKNSMTTLKKTLKKPQIEEGEIMIKWPK